MGKAKSKRPAGRHGGVDQRVYQSRAAKPKHIHRSCISTTRYIPRVEPMNAYLARLFRAKMQQTQLCIGPAQQGYRQSEIILAQPGIHGIRKLNARKSLLDNAAVSIRAVISREQPRESVYGAAVYQNRVKQQGQQQSRRMLAKLPNHSHPKSEHKNTVERTGGVDQSGNQPRSANQKHKSRSSISTSR